MRRPSAIVWVGAALGGALVLRCTPDAPPVVSPSISEPLPAVAATSPAGAQPHRSFDASAPAASATTTTEPSGGRCSLPPADLVKDNMAATSLTGLGEIVSSSAGSPDGGAPPSSGYTNARYEVRVLRWFSGTGPDTMTLVQGVEAPVRLHAPGSLLYFSACSTQSGSAYEPDVGYFFPIEAACRSEVEALGESTAKRAHLGAKHRARACERPR